MVTRRALLRFARILVPDSVSRRAVLGGLSAGTRRFTKSPAVLVAQHGLGR